MKFFLVFIFIIQMSNVFGQRIFKDENDQIITEDVYNKTKTSRGFKVCNDSLQMCKIVVNRSEEGVLENANLLDNLEKFLRIHLDKDKPTIIKFHPGKDLCNSGGIATPETSFRWHKESEEGLRKIKKSNVLYIYKNQENIKTIKKLEWYKDPKGIIESTFFKYHYPCGSYVIIYNNKYRSYFGEYSKDQIYKDLRKILK
ncbi:hypothetical protein GSF70_17320 [Flavobacteriaceae bacterium W22]|nr:hypothetical protein [Flavobacteriaceae bacterium W22]